MSQNPTNIKYESVHLSPMAKEKAELIKKLDNTYCRLQPSGISGVGVFAIRDIPANTNPFEGVVPPKWISFDMDELNMLDPAILRMIDDFNVIESDETVLIPSCALNGMDISFFVNNSDNPNLRSIDEGFTFLTNRAIKKGEELSVSYATNDPKYEKR